MVIIEFLNNCVKTAKKYKKENTEGVAVFLPYDEYKFLKNLYIHPDNPKFQELSMDEQNFNENIHYYLIDLELRAENV